MSKLVDKIEITKGFEIGKIFLIFMLMFFISACQNTNAETSKSQKIGNSISNLISLGLVAQDDNYIYYVVLNTDQPGLYRADLDLKNKTKLSDVDCSYLNVIDDWIYYVNDNDEQKIYKMSIDGQNNQKISDIQAVFLVAYGDQLYAIGIANVFNSKLYAMNFDGSNSKELTDDKVRSIYFYNDLIYYYSYSAPENQGYIYKMGFDGKGKERVLGIDEAHWFCIYKDNVYSPGQGVSLDKINLITHETTDRKSTRLNSSH